MTDNGFGRGGFGSPLGTRAPNRLPDAYLTPGNASFSDFLAQQAPELLPRATSGGIDLTDQVRHGTTIVAATFPGGVVMAGDRRATMGNVIAQRDIRKVYGADEYSCVGVAGAAGLGIDMVRLFRTELEHYEKFEGMPLSIDGKANRLAAMIRQNLGAAMQGLAVVPLLAGYDHAVDGGRIISYDVTGARSEETGFHSIGSGSVFARGSLKKLYRDDLSADEIVTVLVQALYDAADDDSATGGPDMSRKIFPLALVITAEGTTEITEAQMAEHVDSVVTARMNRPNGPSAPLT